MRATTPANANTPSSMMKAMAAPSGQLIPSPKKISIRFP